MKNFFYIFIDENSLVFDLKKDQTILLKKIYEFQENNKYFELIKFQKKNSQFSIEFIDDFLIQLESQKILNFEIDHLGIIFNFKELIDTLNNLNQNVFMSYWSEISKKLWIKKTFQKNIKSGFLLEDIYMFLNDNYENFIVEYSKNINFDLNTFFKEISKKNSSKVNKFEFNNENVINHQEINEEIPLINNKFKSEVFFNKPSYNINNNSKEDNKKLTQKNWFEE